MSSRKHPLNIAELFEWHAQAKQQTVAYLDRPFDIAPDKGTRFDAGQLVQTVRDFSARLYAAGARAGDRVAIVKDNHFDMTLAAAAAARFGAIPATIAGLNTPENHRSMIARLEPSVLVVSPTALANAARAGVELSGPDTKVIVLGELGEGAPDGALALSDLDGADAPPTRLRAPHESMMIMHSSGTTGVPKLVVHSGNSLLGGVARIERIRLPVLASRHHDVVATSVSFAHGRTVSWTIGQFVLAPKKIVIISRHDTDVAERMFEEHRPTSIEACPNVFQRWEDMAHQRPELFRQTRLFIGTFDAIHPRTVRTFLNVSKRRFPLWLQGWGQSEVGPICFAVYTRGRMQKLSDDSSATSDIGWPSPGFTKVKVVDIDTGRTLPKGKPGMMMVATKARCMDYLGESERHAEKINGEWWNTGDIGEMHAFGRIKLVDREVDIIPGTSGIELESILLDRLPRASDVTVLGLPGELPVPVVSMIDNRLDPQEWAAATVGLPPMAEPKLVPWDEVPRTATWKVRRLDLREQVLGSKQAIGTGRWT
ncbi:class I adenylate-forming enzyme family protein [Streptomyces zagrosensis]|uniref:Acyl-coenzyme A synthetase/AMP-(Fatty) acid ligase n=1 Tax=Streptomyces zagrosensis TaxID=1042984 RepID=A0A7W9QB28_9ACTN|nr:class I adenylate-forming enzyme family protein [Streptomyces zagrosensis]MBB5936971.1 acyl-coenzyme A synthetase/AMP-(fatty) acid ligase [Streptomyces zagrosensis]